MKRATYIFLLFFLLLKNSFSQDYDTIAFKNICFNYFCIGDSINSVIKKLGNNYTLTEKYIGDIDNKFIRKDYVYTNRGNTRISEIKITNLESLIFDFNIKDSTIILLKWGIHTGIKLDELFKAYFPKSFNKMNCDYKGSLNKRLYLIVVKQPKEYNIEYISFNFEKDILQSISLYFNW